MKKNNLLLLLVFFVFYSSRSFSQVTITLPNVVGSPNTEVFAAVTVSDLTGKDVYAFQFQINYDPNIVHIDDFNLNGAIISSSPQFAANTTTGYIRFVWAGANPISGQGTLLNIKIKYRNVGSTSLTFDNNFQTKFQTLSQDLNVTKNTGTATVSTTNNPPVFTSVPPKTVNENVLLTFTVSATDPEGLPVTYSTGTLPNGATFNPTTRTFSWTPTYDQQGSYSVQFNANDGNSSSTMIVEITVVNVNRNPTLNLNPASPYNINENQAFTIQLTGSDPDQNSVLNYTSTTLPTGATLTKNSNTSATFSWTPNAQQSGSYTISFTVTDENNGTDSKTAQITVNDVSSPPTLTLNPLPPYTTNEGQILDIQLIGTDPDNGSVLKYSMQNAPTGATLGEVTGLFSWTPQYNQAGSYVITFKVTDETQLSDSKSAQVTVNNVNRAPMFLTKLPPQTVPVHNVPVEFKFQLTGLDPDSDPMFYNLVKGPLGSSITLNGLFKWAPYANQANQQFQVIIELTDGFLSVKDTTTLTGSALVSVKDKGNGIPNEYELGQNYPNPFNPTTTITYGIPEDSFVSIKVFSVLGQEVETLVETYKPAGYYRVEFDAKNLQSGIYFYQINANNYTAIKKMIVVK